MKKYTLGIYAKDNTTMRASKDQLRIFGATTPEENKAIELPALAILPNKTVGVVIDWLEDENVFLVDFDTRKTFTYNLIDQAHKPERLGDLLYLDPATLEFTTEKKEVVVGIFTGMKGDVILFHLFYSLVLGL